ncbi:MAG: hypothetical protein OXI08_10165 [Cyanobacteria bacterium MAG IRC4_bin_6]|nr:hypothetical protein [Cyanobacteria bacterium MAG IRC4_bin_6]
MASMAGHWQGNQHQRLARPYRDQGLEESTTTSTPDSGCPW